MIRSLQPQIKLYLFEHLNSIYYISFHPLNKVILAINYTFAKHKAISQPILLAIKVFTPIAIFKQAINILMNLEGIFLGKICHHLPGFKQRPSGIIFKCPYCQQDDYSSPAKTYSSAKLKGNFYHKKNSTQFKCFSCGTNREFHAFLNDHFPSLFLDYVAERESYGLTGFQTNCPTLKTAQKILNKSSAARPLQSTLNTHPAKSQKPKSPQVKTFPRPTPQQQAGQAVHLVNACKQLRRRGPNHHADLWLSTDTWHSD